MSWQRIISDSIKAGTVAALAMIPFGLAFRFPVSVGALYGAGYYVVINSLLLPICFGDPLPWTLGVGTIVPGL